MNELRSDPSPSPALSLVLSPGSGPDARQTPASAIEQGATHFGNPCGRVSRHEVAGEQPCACRSHRSGAQVVRSVRVHQGGGDYNKAAATQLPRARQGAMLSYLALSHLHEPHHHSLSLTYTSRTITCMSDPFLRQREGLGILG